MRKAKFRSGIFVSYSHSDRDWLQRLKTHLAPYVRGENLDLWDDTRIIPGSDWAEEIEEAIAKARVAVLLVSPEFLASEYITQVELPAILRLAGTDLTVIWIPVRPSAFHATLLKNYQAAQGSLCACAIHLFTTITTRSPTSRCTADRLQLRFRQLVSANVEVVEKVIFYKFAVNRIKYLRVGKWPKSGFFYRLVGLNPGFNNQPNGSKMIGWSDARFFHQPQPF
jgi:hypothetical protein